MASMFESEIYFRVLSIEKIKPWDLEIRNPTQPPTQFIFLLYFFITIYKPSQKIKIMCFMSFESCLRDSFRISEFFQVPEPT